MRVREARFLRGRRLCVADVRYFALEAMVATALSLGFVGITPGIASAACPNEALRGGPSGSLPDCRAYEQATPVEKNGLNANGGRNLVQAATDGRAVTFFDEAGLPGSEGAQENQIYLASHFGDEWSTRGLLPPASLGPIGKVLGLSDNLTSSFVTTREAPAGVPFTFYMRDNTTGDLTQIATGIKQQFAFVGASAGASTVAFEAKTQLPGTTATEGKNNVYVWDRASGSIKLASVLNTGSPPTTAGSFAGPYRWWPGPANTANGGALDSFYVQAEHVLSADGSRIFFTSSKAAPAIYLRENPTQAQSPFTGEEDCSDPALSCTLQVSKSERTPEDPNGAKPAAFIGATTDGSSAFFMSQSQLTNESNTGPTDAGNDLYRYQADAPAGSRLTDLSYDPASSNGAEVKGVLGFSGDGSYVYFVAAASLPGTGAPASTCSGTAQSVTGLCNLYVWHEEPTTGDIETSFVAQLDSEKGINDVLNWSPRANGLGSTATVPTARVAANGTLLFSSIRSLTGYDNAGPECVVEGQFKNPGPCSEIFRYAPGALNPLSCVSCSPVGAPAVAAASLSSIEATALPLTRPTVFTRNISADGNRIFFESPIGLVSADTNGAASCPLVFTPGGSKEVRRCQDVYEWEAAGSGSCPSVSGASGCIYLLSTGTNSEPSFFADNDEAGSNAFFFTYDQLVGQDKDALLDVYDAAVNGGIAGQHPAEPGICDEDSCRGAPTPPPSAASPGSATFAGPGNQPPPKPHKKKHHKATKHHKAKHKKHKPKSAGRGHK